MWDTIWRFLFCFFVLWQGFFALKQGIDQCRCTERWCDFYEGRIQKEYLREFLKQRGIWHIVFGIGWFLFFLLGILLGQAGLIPYPYRDGIAILLGIVMMWVMFAPYVATWGYRQKKKA